MADFSTAPTTQGTSIELIPDGTLAKGWLTIRPWNADQGIIEKPSEKGVSFYLDGEVTIIEGPFERRKLFPKIMRGPKPNLSGDDTKKAERNLNMGNAQIRAILEYGRNAGPSNPSGYVLPGEAGQEFAPWCYDGIPVAIKIGIEKGQDRPGGGKYDDKNNVKLFLSPNPESDGHKDFLRLQKGETGTTKTAAPASAQPAWNKPATTNLPLPPATAAPAAQAAQPQGRPAWMNNAR